MNSVAGLVAGRALGGGGGGGGAAVCVRAAASLLLRLVGTAPAVLSLYELV